jgi:hypothetical protein
MPCSGYFLNIPRTRIQRWSMENCNYASLKSLNSLESPPKTMRYDEFSGPGNISLSQE